MPSSSIAEGLARASRPSFSIERVPPNDTLRMRLAGEVDIASEAELAGVLDRALERRRGGLLLLDLGEVELLGLAALHLLLDAERLHRERGGRLYLQHVPESVERCLRLCGLAGAFEILDPAPRPRLADRPAVRPWSERDRVGVDGPVSPTTIELLEREVLRCCGRDVPVRIDLRRAVVSSGRVTVQLGAVLRRLAHLGCDLVVIGAPPRLQLLLSVCAEQVRTADR